MYQLQLPKKIDVETAAVIITNDRADSIEPTVVRIHGKLHKPLFKQHYFEGSFIIDGIEATKKDWQNKIPIVKHNNGINMGSLFYSSPIKPHDFTFVSTIYFDDEFENINIWTAASWLGGDEKDSLFIVTGTNYEQAVETQNQLRKQFDNDDWFVPKAGEMSSS
ncbi:hypothetical protein [Paenibacillus cellulosilyticus]|uniref:hypothetical protein n=1 Tax=Paenibacillus cellulosilyticus TaxID=375489 RepID=UPI000D70D97F|nr:hypothetical protein [Paenibacillus cellulosilyticus]